MHSIYSFLLLIFQIKFPYLTIENIYSDLYGFFFVSFSDDRIGFRLNACTSNENWAVQFLFVPQQLLNSHVIAIRSSYECWSCLSWEWYGKNATTTTNNPCIRWSNTLFGFNSRYIEGWMDCAFDERRATLLLQVSKIKQKKKTPFRVQFELL